MDILNSIIGIIFIFIVAFLLSNNKKKINWRTIIIGFLIQLCFAVIVLKSAVGKKALQKVATISGINCYYIYFIFSFCIILLWDNAIYCKDNRWGFSKTPRNV